MKNFEKDVIDSLCERQTLNELMNYSDEFAESEERIEYYYKNFVSNNNLEYSDELHNIMIESWNKWVNHWKNRRDNYIKKSINVSWYQDKTYLNTGKE